MKTIALVTQKGGAGKSTLASSLAVAALEAGERVCLIDHRPAGDADRLGQDARRGRHSRHRRQPRQAPGGAVGARAEGRDARLHRHARRRGRGGFGGDGGGPALRHSLAPHRLRPLGQRQHPQGAEGSSRAITCSCSTNARRRSRTRASTRAWRRWRRWAACSRRWCWRGSITRKPRALAGASPNSIRTARRRARCARCGPRLKRRLAKAARPAKKAA